MAYTFTYRAMNDMGRTIKGEMTAENELDLEAKLKTLGMDVVDYREVKPRKPGMFSRVKMKDMIIFCMHMEQLDRAGVPLHEALEDARDATDSLKLQNVLTSVYEDIKAGKIFSKALSEHPTVFNEVFVGLVAAGEKTGNMQESFLNLCDHMKWVSDLRRKVRKSIAYPTVLAVVLTAVISVLMLFVVPQLIDFITTQGFEIPAHTHALIATSEFFGEYWYAILPSPLIIGSIFFGLYRTSDAFAYRIDALMLRAPIIGPVVSKINMARFTHFFAVMFSSGVDILDSLMAGRDVVKNRVLRESIELVHRGVMDGNRLTESIRISNQFPNLVVE
jgi:type IV pilus assembly protein PilC